VHIEDDTSFFLLKFSASKQANSFARRRVPTAQIKINTICVFKYLPAIFFFAQRARTEEFFLVPIFLVLFLTNDSTIDWLFFGRVWVHKCGSECKFSPHDHVSVLHMLKSLEQSHARERN